MKLAAQFTWASMCWTLNFGFMFVLIRLMALHAPPPALEIFSYAGYSFVGYCVSIVLGWALGRKFGWYAAWCYTSCCMAIFLIRTVKQVIRVDAAHRGTLLALARVQAHCKVHAHEAQ
jgi:protein transport protein YIF1